MPFNVNGVCQGGNSDNAKVTECLVQQGTADRDAVDGLVALNGGIVNVTTMGKAAAANTDLISANGNGVDLSVTDAPANGEEFIAEEAPKAFNVGTIVKITFDAALANADETVVLNIGNIGVWSTLSSSASGGAVAPADATKTKLTITAKAAEFLIAAGDTLVIRCVSKTAAKTGTWILESMSTKSTTTAVSYS
jgi:hypothetical protein